MATSRLAAPGEDKARWILLGLGIALLLGMGGMLAFCMLVSRMWCGTDIVEPTSPTSVTGLRARMPRVEAVETLKGLGVLPEDIRPIEDPDEPRRPRSGRKRTWFEVARTDVRLGPPGRLLLQFEGDELIELRYRPVRDAESYFQIRGRDAPNALGWRTSDSGVVYVHSRFFGTDENAHLERVWTDGRP